MPDVVAGWTKRAPSGSGPIPCGPGPTRGAAHPATATSPNPSTQRLPVISRFLSHVVWSIRVTPSRLGSLRVLHRNADAVLREELFARATDVVPLADRFGRGRQARENRPPVRFRDHAAIQEYHGPHVGARADQAAKSLFQLERRVRQEIVRKPVQAACGQAL